jgi:hypothetical protein
MLLRRAYLLRSPRTDTVASLFMPEIFQSCYFRRVVSSGIWRLVVRWKRTDVSQEYVAVFVCWFLVWLTFRSWRWRKKCLITFSWFHGIISQKVRTFIPAQSAFFRRIVFFILSMFWLADRSSQSIFFFSFVVNEYSCWDRFYPASYWRSHWAWKAVILIDFFRDFTRFHKNYPKTIHQIRPWPLVSTPF